MDDGAFLKTYGNTDLPEGTEDRPLVTFALFAYNQEKYIREAVEGAFSQTYSPLEIILSDDCSSDRTFEIMQEMASAYRGPHRVVMDRTPTNLGRITFGRRVWSLLSRCNGELIVMAAGDDVSTPDRTQILLNAWNRGGRKVVCVHSKALPIDANGAPIAPESGDNSIASLSLERFIAQDGRGLLGATNAISREILSRFGPFPDVLLIEDGALAFRAKLADGILFVPQPLVLYRRHADNFTNQAELQSGEFLQKYVLGLAGQHAGFLADYVLSSKIIDPDILSIVAKRIMAAKRISYLHNGNFWQRIVASLSYSVRFPFKRRIWLLLNSLHLVHERGKN